jgi:hypothetical protein
MSTFPISSGSSSADLNLLADVFRHFSHSSTMRSNHALQRTAAPLFLSDAHRDLDARFTSHLASRRLSLNLGRSANGSTPSPRSLPRRPGNTSR